MYRELLKAINEEAVSAGRDPKSIRLIAVTKNHPWSEAASLYQEGCRLFGENRVQEGLPKLEEAPEDCEWHLIGSLQKNKVNKVVGKFSLIHSVDSIELASKISEVSLERGLKSSILLQVNVSGERSKHGFNADGFHRCYEGLSELSGVSIEGLMTMAPQTEDSHVRLECFNGLKALGDELGLKELSMGMSGDWREAVQAGSTLLRIGSALFY